MNSRHLMRLLTLATCLFAACLAINAEVVGEEEGGVLTGPFNIALYLGFVWLLAAALFSLARLRASFAAAVVGAVLIAPMQLWRLAPGVFCATSSCSAEYPTFAWSFSSAATLALSAAAVGFSMQLRKS